MSLIGHPLSAVAQRLLDAMFLEQSHEHRQNLLPDLLGQRVSLRLGRPQLVQIELNEAVARLAWSH